ncbi:MAG: peptidyl-prolyl cis-trans isomerase (rotamase) - cyclophilin family [Chthoniobacteraceae bacterium]|nr:peptidyl-prolyl cis-trans isomerase (rotamase) - cyclophilin family [Chthoniobacteraceae bacterium]
MKAHSLSPIEPLEARIAPALTLVNALPDIVAGVGKTGALIDLSGVFGDASSFHTKVQFTTNFDTDTTTPGLQAGIIVFELFDDAAPLTVQNFLQYVNNTGKGDYDGTFFHRSVSGFVLQGGGFEATAPASHIPIGAEVHNEYDSSRSNLTGTIAMAKIGTGPNTASSEFFINLGDNSSNLDNQNGGFTVFGKVTAGMDVINAIAARPQKDFSGTVGAALGSVPVQPSYTGTGVPTAADFITITDAKVIAPTHTTADGVTFSVVSITDNATQFDSTLVTGNLIGADSLALNYAAGKSGTATVKIKASQAGAEDQFDSFQVTVKPNLATSIVSDGLAAVLVPGASGKVRVELTNNGAALLTGKADVSFYLSKVTDSDPTGTLFDSSDRPVGSISGKTVKLASGASTFLSGKLKGLPDASIDKTQNELFRLIAVTEVHNAADNVTVSELFADDNVAIDGNIHRFISTPNLVSEVVADKLPGSIIVPGDTGAITLKLSNNGYTQLTGTVDVTFYLSMLNSADPNGVFFDPGIDTKIGVLHNLDVNLGTGKSALVTGDISIPTELAATRGQSYRIIAEITSVPSGGGVLALNEFDASDNLSATAGTHALYNAFGNLLERKNAPLHYTDADGNQVTLTMKGSGFGEILVSSTGELDLALYNTTASSAVSGSVAVAVGGAAGTQPHTALHNIYSSGGTSQPIPIGTVLLGAFDVHGEIEFSGGIKSLTLGNLIDSKTSASHLIDIGAFAGKGNQALSVKFGSVTDYEFRSFMPVNSIAVQEWIDSNATIEQLAMVSLKSFSAAGNLEDSVYANIDFNQVAYSKVKLTSFTVGGALDHATVQIGGDVGKVALGSMNSSYFYAGVIATPNEAPNYIFAPHTLDSFVVKGATGIFKDSVVGAGNIGSVSIQNVDGSGGPGAYGVVAYAIKSYLREQGAASPFTGTNLTPDTYDVIGNYSVRVI